MRLPRRAEIWMPGYIADRARRLSTEAGPKRVWLMIADHFEPLWKTTDMALAQSRVTQWHRRWPAIAERFRDSAGFPPRYCFFYPEEEYRPSLLDPLAEMTAAGIADVEIHIHHDGESEVSFVDRVSRYAELLFSKHGLLRRVQDKIVFAFIHGNFALDNSNGGRFCGLNNEITLLRDLGCYADFTMPSGSHSTQARLLNRVYWATDDPHSPKSYDTGAPLEPGKKSSGDLLIIPGPFGLRWRGRLMPRMEIGELSGDDPPTSYRAQRWLDLAPRIGNDVFLKLYTHGTQERNLPGLLGSYLENVFAFVQRECERRGWSFYFATAWEMRQAVDAAWRGTDSAAVATPQAVAFKT